MASKRIEFHSMADFLGKNKIDILMKITMKNSDFLHNSELWGSLWTIYGRIAVKFN